jgi:hypothetical protein
MSIVAGANILVTLKANYPTSDELDVAQALSSIAVLDTLSDLDSDDETFGFDNSKRETFAQENVFRNISAKHIENIVRKSRLPLVVCTRESSRKRLKVTTTDESGLDYKHNGSLQKRKKQRKSKFQQAFEEFDMSHFAVSGPYLVPHRVIQDCRNGLYPDHSSLAKSLIKAHEFGSKHPNVWHLKYRVLLPDITLCSNRGMCYARNLHKLHFWTNVSVTPEKDSLVVCNVGKRSFFIVWNES